jgi:hypothetical protein
LLLKTFPIPIGFERNDMKFILLNGHVHMYCFKKLFACYLATQCPNQQQHRYVKHAEFFVFVIVRSTGCACVDGPVCVDERPFRSKQQGTADYVIRIHK